MKIPAIGVIAIVGLVLWLVGKDKFKIRLGAQGKLHSLVVDGAGMGEHQVVKAPGAAGTITVVFSGATRDFQGVGITWSYRVRLVVQHSVGGTFSWEPLSGDIFSVGFLEASSPTYSYTVPDVAPAGLYSVTAFLQAQESDTIGNPTGVFTDIPGVSMTHPNAINVVTTPAPPPSGPVTPEGGIGTVDVAQAILRQMQS